MRVTLLCQAASAATFAARFADDDPADPERLARLHRSPPRLPRADVIMTSPARAARDTAAALDLAAQAEPALRDLDCGRWAGWTLQDLGSAEPDAVAAWLGDPAAAPHGGESLDALLDRVGHWLNALPTDSGPVLAITHAAVIRAAVLYALGAGASSIWRIDVPPLGLARLSGGGRRWTLTALVPP